MGEHIVKNQLHPLGRRHVLLPVVRYNAFRRVNDGVTGKPGFVHGLPQVGRGLRRLLYRVALHGPLIAAAHGLLEGEVCIRDQGIGRFLIVVVQLRVVELEGVHVSAANRLHPPPVDVLLRVDLEHLAGGVHAHGALLVGPENGILLGLRHGIQVRPLPPKQNLGKNVSAFAVLDIFRPLCYSIISIERTRTLNRRLRLCPSVTIGGKAGWIGTIPGVYFYNVPVYRRLHTGGGVLRALCGVCGGGGISTLTYLWAYLLRRLCVRLTVSTLPDNINTRADTAHGRAHRRVIQCIAQIKPGRGVIGGPLQNGLENILDKFLTALGDHGEGHAARRTVIQLGKRTADGVVQNAAAERLLEWACHVADLLRGKAQRTAPQSVGKLLAIGGPSLSGLLGAAPGGTGRHQGKTGSGDHGAGRHVPRHLHTLNAQIHGELARLAQPLFGPGDVLGRAFRQLVRFAVRLVCHGLVALFHSLGVVLVGVDLPLVGGDVGPDFLPIIRCQRLAVRPFPVSEHGVVVLDGLNGPHLLPGGVVVGDHGVQFPGPLRQNAAGIHVPGPGGLCRAGHDVLDSAGRIVFGAGGVCHKSLPLSGVRGAFPPPAGGHPLILAGAGFGGGSRCLVYGRLPLPGRDHLIEALGNGVRRRFLGSLSRSRGRCAPAPDYRIQTIFNTAHSPSWLPPK